MVFQVMKHVMAGGEALGPEEPTKAAEKAAVSRLPVEEAWDLQGFCGGKTDGTFFSGKENGCHEKKGDLNGCVPWFEVTFFTLGLVID